MPRAWVWGSRGLGARGHMGLMMTPPPMQHSGPSVEARKQTMAMMSRLSMPCPVA